MYNSAIGIAQFRNDGHDGLFLHVLLREVTIDSGGYGAGLSLQRVGSDGEVVC